METLIGSSKIACKMMESIKTITAWKADDESSVKWRLNDKVWKVGNVVMKTMALVVYIVA